MFCVKLIPLFFVLFIYILQNNVNAELQAEGIRGGDKAKEGEISYQISIQVGRAHICGGSIISDRHILTAAHCVLDDEGKFEEVQMSAVAGVNYTRAKGIRVPIEKIYVPKEYNPRRPRLKTPYRPTGDIAVLKLKEDLGVGSFNLTKLSLPKSIKSNTAATPSYSSYENRTAVVSGFGYNWVEVAVDPKNNRTFENTGGSDHYLRYAETKVLNSAKCAKLYENPIHDSNLCAQVKQRDPQTVEAVCSLDSGGPLVYKKNTIIGVLNNSPIGCDETAVAAVYARVTSFLPFIQNAMEDNKTNDMRVATWTIKDEEMVLLIEN